MNNYNIYDLDLKTHHLPCLEFANGFKFIKIQEPS